MEAYSPGAAAQARRGGSGAENARAVSWAGRLVRYSVRFLMMTRKMCCYLHKKRVGQCGGHPPGTVLSALFDDDTPDVLLFAQETRGPFRGRPI